MRDNIVTIGGDPVLALLHRYNIPVTREAYLQLAYLGEPPEPLSAEQEANLPRWCGR